MAIPDLAAVKTYLGGETSASDAEITSALAAETALQAAMCRIPAAPEDYPVPLGEALCRRVARNLYMRRIPSGLETINTEAGGMGVRISTDPEIKRMEAPYRRLVVG